MATTVAVKHYDCWKHENIEGYIPNFGQYKSSRKGFEYDKEKDCYICSQGKILEYKSIRRHWNGEMKQYRSSSKDCSVCPLKSQCINKGSFKTIAVTVDKELFERMHHRLQTPTARRMKKLRSSTVEPVLGTLVNFLGMRRVYTKGISLADKCMTTAAIAYNLKKLMKWEDKKKAGRYKSINAEHAICFLMLKGSIKRLRLYYSLTFKNAE